MRDTIVLKIGGNEIDDEGFLDGLVAAIAALRRTVAPVLVHGGGKEIARLQTALGLEPRFVEGLRVTDEESLRVAEMVLSGTVNKRLVAQLVGPASRRWAERHRRRLAARAANDPSLR